jgi:hypothetical protein
MPTKTNEKETINSAVDVTAQVTKETKAALEEAMNITVHLAADAKTLLVANLEMLESSFATWQEYNQAYTKFVLQATQQFLTESLAFRENLDRIMSDNLKKAHLLSEQERQIILDSTVLFQDQVRTASESAIKTLTTTSKAMTTTALFTDWAAEHAAKMFTTISTN